jgi:hypothetical protein
MSGDNHSKRRAKITDVAIHDGVVLCNGEDMDRPGRTYTATLMRPISGQVNIPKIGSEVLIERLHDEEWVIMGVLSTPGATGADEEQLRDAARDGHDSVSLVLDPGGDGEAPEKISVEYRDGGYILDVDLDGDITLKTDGNVNLGSKSGSPVALKGNAVSIDDPLTGPTGGSITEGSSTTSSE